MNKIFLALTVLFFCCGVSFARGNSYSVGNTTKSYWNYGNKTVTKNVGGRYIGMTKTNKSFNDGSSVDIYKRDGQTRTIYHKNYNK